MLFGFSFSVSDVASAQCRNVTNRLSLIGEKRDCQGPVWPLKSISKVPTRTLHPYQQIAVISVRGILLYNCSTWYLQPCLPHPHLDRVIVGRGNELNSFFALATVCTSSGARRDEELLHPPSQDSFVALVSLQIRLALLKCSSMMSVVSILIFLLLFKAVLVAGELS